MRMLGEWMIAFLLLCVGCSMLANDLKLVEENAALRANALALQAQAAREANDPNADELEELSGDAKLYYGVATALGALAVLVDRRYFHNKRNGAT